MLPRVPGNVANGIEAVRASNERALRLEAHITESKVRIIAPDVGGITYDQVGVLAGKRCEPLTGAQLYMLQPVCEGILSRDAQRRGRTIRSDNVV